MKIMNKKAAIGILIAILFVTFISVVVIASSSSFSVPYTFTSGTTISASEMNANFQAIAAKLPYSKVSETVTNVAIGANTTNTIVTLTVTPPMDGYLKIYGRVNFSDVTISDTTSSCGIQIRVASSGLINAGSKSFITNISGEYNDEIVQGAVTGGTSYTYYLNVNAWENTTATISSANMTAVFTPAPNTLP
jgi:hypothetical protein